MPDGQSKDSESNVVSVTVIVQQVGLEHLRAAGSVLGRRMRWDQEGGGPGSTVRREGLWALG